MINLRIMILKLIVYSYIYNTQIYKNIKKIDVAEITPIGLPKDTKIKLLTGDNNPPKNFVWPYQITDKGNCYAKLADLLDFPCLIVSPKLGGYFCKQCFIFHRNFVSNSGSGYFFERQKVENFVVNPFKNSKA